MEGRKVFERYIKVFNGMEVVQMADVKKLSIITGCTIREIELMFLNYSIVPYKYSRNIKMPEIGIEGQKKLLESKICVIGCGGTGGYIIELLARLGVGNLIVVDGDIFDESNLNRQSLCKESSLGLNKANAAKKHVNEINSSVDLVALPNYLIEDNAREIVKGCNVVIDAVDDINTRLILEKACNYTGVKLIHGTIGNSVLRLSTVPKDGDIMHRIYVKDMAADKEIGALAPTVAICGALQVAEAIKQIIGIGDTIDNRLLIFDWVYYGLKIINI